MLGERLRLHDCDMNVPSGQVVEQRDRNPCVRDGVGGLLHQCVSIWVSAITLSIDNS